MSEKADKKGDDRTAADVDRIRDIIFGSQIQQYEQRFGGVASQLELLEKRLAELKGALDQQRDAQEGRTREVQEEMRQRNTELKRTLSGQIGQVETTFALKTTQIQDESHQSEDALRDEVFARLERQSEDLAARIRQLGTDLRQQGSDLRSELAAAVNALGDEKASRHNLGSLLMEMGMRLKGEREVTDLLEQLQGTPQNKPKE